jgi:tetratricopeptide (TPR) repeat protein
MKFYLLLLVTFCCTCVFAQRTFEFNAPCKSAHEAILGLQFKNAKSILLKERKNNPQNLIPFYLDNYIDFLTIVISEEKPRFDLLKNNKSIRLDLIEKGDKNSPYYLLTQAEINLQWAFARIKFNEYLTAALEVNKAFKMLEENQKKFPDFVLNKKCLGLLHAAVGTIPDEYKWAIKLFGFEGSIKQGEAEVKEVYEITLSHPTFSSFNSEAVLLLSILELNLLNNENFVAQHILPVLEKEKKPNPIQVFCYANSCMKIGKTDAAIAYLETNKFGKDVFPFAYLNYMLGQAKLCRLDKDANIPLELFLKTFKGINFVKAAHLRLGWHYLISGDRTKYLLSLSKVKNTGASLVDEDKQAKHESESAEIPNVSLLKSRLLFDGGYYYKAQEELTKNSTKKMKSVKDNLEVIYRLARIYHKQNKFDKAISNYELTFKNGSSYPYYFAANSALQLGLIYEEEKNYSKAKEYYLQCLSLKNHEYQNSISQKAKAGLNRVAS